MENGPYKTIYVRVTDACNQKCSFCYQRRRTSRSMSIDTVVRALEFIDSLSMAEGSWVYLWGGEPFCNREAVLHFIKNYRNLTIISTNGVYVDAGILDVLRHNPHVRIVWSIGDARECFGSIQNKFKAHPELLDYVKVSKSLVHLVVTHPSLLVEDYTYLLSQGITNIDIDYIRYKSLSSEYINNFTGSLSQLIKLGFKPQHEPMLCTAGVHCLFIDPVGDLWPCDAWYEIGQGKFGSVYNGIDKPLWLQETVIARKEVKVQQFCEGCPIVDNCGVKCLAHNFLFTGHRLKPYASHCEMQRARIKNC